MNALRPVGGRTSYAFSHAVGTGGIGTGMFMLLEESHTLGRNESRAARLMPYKDYCKLHIIFHYMAVLLGAGRPDGFPVWPIGKVGADDAGSALRAEMAAAGMEMTHVAASAELPTMLSVCFQYPDSTGGNITTSNGASSAVSAEDIAAYFHGESSMLELAGSRHRGATAALGQAEGGCGVSAVEDGLTIEGRGASAAESATDGQIPGAPKFPGLAVAAPEVPLETRLKLLAEARARGWFTAASLLSSEAAAFGSAGGYGLVDLLALNVDEAAAIAGLDAGAASANGIAAACAAKLAALRPHIALTVTDGPRGCYVYADGRLAFTPPLPAQAVGTGGAGDAFLAGTLAGLICGLPLHKAGEDSHFGETPLGTAPELGTLLASLSVTSPHSIHPGADAESLLRYAEGKRLVFSADFEKVFSACGSGRIDAEAETERG